MELGVFREDVDWNQWNCLLSNITTLCTRVTERHGHWEPWVDQQRSPWNGRQPWVGQQLWVVGLLWVGRKRSLGTYVVSARETQGRTSHTCSGQISNNIYEREMKSGKCVKKFLLSEVCWPCNDKFSSHILTPSPGLPSLPEVQIPSSVGQ